MKEIRLVTGIQIVLIVIFIVVVGIVIVGSLSSNNSMATVPENQNQHEETIIIKGDVNEDGQLDIKDIFKINRYRLKGEVIN